MTVWEIIGRIADVVGIVGVSLGALLAWIFRGEIAFRFRHWNWRRKNNVKPSDGYVIIVGNKVRTDLEADVKAFCEKHPKLKEIKAFEYVSISDRISPADIEGIINDFNIARKNARARSENNVMHFFTNAPLMLACQLTAPLYNHGAVYLYQYTEGRYVEFGLLNQRGL